MKSFLTIAACVVAGAVAGMAASLLHSTHAMHAQQRSDLPEPSTAPVIVAPIDTSNIERQLQELRERMAAQAAASAAPSSSVSPSGLDGVSSGGDENLKQYRAALQAHEQEPVDPTWAPSVQKAYSADLSNISTANKFQVRSVDCRTTTCVAALSFDTFKDARTRWMNVLTARYKSRCGTEVMLDGTPSESDRPYDTRVIYNCESVRAGE